MPASRRTWRKHRKERSHDRRIIVVAVVLLFALVVASRAIRVIPQARAGVVERLGRYSRTLEPGLTIVDAVHRPRASRWWTCASRS